MIPKPAYVVTPPNLSSPTYKHFKSSQPLTAQTRANKRVLLYGEMPARGTSNHSQHYQHKYHSPPSPPRKRISQTINTPRFAERTPSPRPAPDQYFPTLKASGPSYSFGSKLGERVNEVGPGRTSWEKTWFASSDVWKVKTDFETKWPEIGGHEGELNYMGKRLPHLRAGPAPSFGIKLIDIASKKKSVPSPMAYNTGRSVNLLYKASPSFTIVRKDYSQDRWIKNRDVPGPGQYAPNLTAVKPKTPAFSFAPPSPSYTQPCA
ncbi:hypothetical protein ACHWQZ_G019643 [Mnemiopsis leidyi]